MYQHALHDVELVAHTQREYVVVLGERELYAVRDGHFALVAAELGDPDVATMPLAVAVDALLELEQKQARFIAAAEQLAVRPRNHRIRRLVQLDRFRIVGYLVVRAESAQHTHRHRGVVHHKDADGNVIGDRDLQASLSCAAIVAMQ